MLPLGMILAFAGYGLGSWGYILVRGDNITLREWFSPIHPFTGSLDAAGKVPQGSIFPTRKGGAPAAGSNAPGQNPIQKQQKQNLKTKGRPPVQ